ncbi:MAG: ion transporter [Phycisphaerales bacterium]|nr:ion transporter [Phycisphaerales bacterium]
MTEHPFDRTQAETTAYDVFISIAAVASIAIVSWAFWVKPDTELGKLLNYFDYFFCLLFFIDYLKQIMHAESRTKYLFGWGLLDLASSIPAIGPLRYIRIARVLQVLRAIRSARILVQVYRRDRVGTAIVLSILIAFGGIILSCIGVLHFESQSADATIKTADDVMWWAVVTTSTVGYGDYAPVTGPGRLLAALVMVLGIGLFATLAGAIASRMTNLSRLDPQQTKSMRRDMRNYDAVEENKAILQEIKDLIKQKNEAS